MKGVFCVEFSIIVTGEVIQRERISKNRSQEVLSGFAVMSRSHWSEIEHGHHPELALQTFWKIADALELRPSELMRLIEEETERRKREENEQKQE
jgi:transcriptional regulator with XRE-family HTH domain